MRTYARSPVEFVRGEGARLSDAAGEEYLDFLCGISVTSVGHCHPRVVAAVCEQAERLTHVGNLYSTEPPLRLAQRLSESSLGGRVFLCNSGAEADEAAIKLARKARPGGDLVVVDGAFHGVPTARSPPLLRSPSRRPSHCSSPAFVWSPPSRGAARRRGREHRRGAA